MNQAVVQMVILASSALAMYLIARGERIGDAKTKRIGSVIGLIGQPFWLWHSVESNAWGVFILTLVFASSYWTIFRANRRAS